MKSVDSTTVCSVCDFPTWLAEHCGVPTVEPQTCLRRESTIRPGAFRLICGRSLREGWHVGEADFVNCPDCLRIMAREIEAATALSPTVGGGAYPPSDPHTHSGSSPRHPRTSSNPHTAKGSGAEAADDAAR